MSIEKPRPLRGEVWQVNFDPAVGAEIQKKRPAIVISSDSVGRLPIKLVAPVTSWKDAFTDNIWHVRIEPNSENGLQKPSAVDTLQVRGMDMDRFLERLGKVHTSILNEISLALASVIEFDAEDD